MTLDEMLREMAAGFADLLGRFMPVEGHSVLDTADAARFQRLCLEARALLNHQLGENDWSAQLLTISVRDTARLLSGPTFGSVVSAQNIVLAAANTVQRQAVLAAANRPQRHVAPYVSDIRLAELRAIASPHWDLTRLLRLCEELNTAHESGSLMTTAMVVRSIMDHVPPIFACTDFSAVANNCAGGRSIKSSLLNLQNSLRNVGDAHLHVQIRQREVLPTPPQVDFKADLDVLLGEVVRTLK